MNATKNLPELEACGWFVRTKRTAADPAGWLVADCSAMGGRGAEFAKLFAASRAMADALLIALEGVPEIQSSVRLTMEAALVRAGLMTVEPQPERAGADDSLGHMHAPVRHIRICGDGID
ncbi:hypothetical protein [Paraburkholderia kururiensis]|uniref:hypothetical protein n=1 Tax=Paraburkholderia kururiensis TaxID=984307 RepID=UPI000ACC0A9C|nr:hypothetical protein [Paraburkholderia kururiensis]